MIDLIRVSALPSNLMQSAAKGSLAVPRREMIEILVHLALHNKIFSQQAQLTLAGWDEAASREMAEDPSCPKQVLDYMVSPKNLRPALLPALLSNRAVSEDALTELASHAGRDAVEAMLKQDRILQSPPILKALLSNPNLSGIQSETVRNILEPAPQVPAAEPGAHDSQPPSAEQSPAGEASSEESSGEQPVPALDEVFTLSPANDSLEGEELLDEGVLAYLSEHAGEIDSVIDQTFQPIGGFYDELVPSAEEPLSDGASTSAGAAAAAQKAPSKKSRLTHEEERGSALQKISKLDIKGRIQLAIKGSKEERSLLIRDGTKIVALAVLESPKVTDGEVERFASQKNVLEAVLRGIPMKRRFFKNYTILRNLVFNPRTPLDVSLGLIKNLLVGDLRHLSGNKEVSDTVRKLALKMLKQKSEAGGKR